MMCTGANLSCQNQGEIQHTTHAHQSYGQKKQAFVGTYFNIPSNTGTFTLHDFSVHDFGED